MQRITGSVHSVAGNPFGNSIDQERVNFLRPTTVAVGGAHNFSIRNLSESRGAAKSPDFVRLLFPRAGIESSRALAA